MSNSYSQRVTYDQPGMVAYNQAGYSIQKEKNHAAAALCLGGTAGAIGGGIIGARKNPYLAKSGEPAENFAVSVYERFIKKNPEAGKSRYKQGLNILKKLKWVKSTDELRTLMVKNAEAANDIYIETGKGAEEFLSSVTDSTLSGNKKLIKEKINAGNKARYQDIKNRIAALWDKENGKFIKPEGEEAKVYNAIKNVEGRIKSASIAKAAIVGAVITGAIAYIVNEIFAAKKGVSK